MSEMDKPTPPHVAADTPIGPDVDLAADEVITPDGHRLSDAVVAELIEQAAQRSAERVGDVPQ